MLRWLELRWSIGFDLDEDCKVVGLEGAGLAGTGCAVICGPLVCDEYPESLATSRGGAERYLSMDFGGLELVVALRLASLRVSGLTRLSSLS